MKNIVLLLAVLFGMTACKNEVKKVTTESQVVVEKPINNGAVKRYPSEVKTIFDAHGGTEAWFTMNRLYFELPKENATEKHTVALSDRRSLIETEQWSVGYDGTDVWVMGDEKEVYSGNARFYHNLMFYFYAMPFVLADDGINYNSVATTELDGKLYEGIKISYNDGIGDASDDEYIVYFDAETGLMTWLGYTVTYRTQEKSDNWKYIKYAEWQKINGLLLPKTLTWYTVVDGKPTEPRNSMNFENVQVSENLPDGAQFVKPDGATISER